MSEIKYYAGIGSRKTPPDMCAKMTAISTRLQKLGYVLRSGGAGGADKAFEDGVDSFNTRVFRVIYTARDSTPEAEKIAETIHPAWHNCNEYARKLHGRNCQIILGKNLTSPVKFVVCWVNTRCLGGTRTGIVLARRHCIPVFNLFNPADEETLMQVIKHKEEEWAKQ